ncbi:hypothetical protein [Isosphaera pallida]|uniref:hypothetical protein n=1 Tax=Isosphaera pallida TaxID=128 RepID=UPI0011D1EE59|nr:hypothetical protein [Isosphaera pallida]
MVEVAIKREGVCRGFVQGVLALGLLVTLVGCGGANPTPVRPGSAASATPVRSGWSEADRRRLAEALHAGRGNQALADLLGRLQTDPLEPESASWALAVGYVLGRPGDWVVRLVGTDPWWRRLSNDSIWRDRHVEQIRAGAELLLLDGRSDLAGVWLEDPQCDHQPILLDLKAVAALERGEFDAAQHAWNASIAVDPRRATPWLLRARWARRQGDERQAAECFEKARSLRPDEPILLREYAGFERGRGRLQHAAALLARAQKVAEGRMIQGGMGAVEDRPERPRSILPIEVEAPPPFVWEDLLTWLNHKPNRAETDPERKVPGP